MVRKAVLQALGREPSSTAPQRYQVTGRKFITEADVQGLAPGSELVVPANALLTPLARDLILQLNLKLTRQGEASLPAVSTEETAGMPATDPERTVALGADHGGFALKEVLKSHLQELGYAVLDCGTHSSESVDYPDFAYAVAKWVSEGRAARGIMVDGAGIGSCMAANKVPGVRAALCYDLSTAVNSREHNDANVLTLGGGLIGPNLAREIVKTWLTTPFGGGRHGRRVDKIMAIEQRYSKR